MEVVNNKTKLASIGYTQGRLGLSPSAYYKKTKEERLKLRRKAYNLAKKSGTGVSSKKTSKRKKSKKKGFFERLFDGC